MKKLIIILLLLVSNKNFANPNSPEGGNIKSLEQLDKIPLSGTPPTTEDCDCDGEEDKKKSPNKKSKIISFTIGLEQDGNGNRKVSEYDCWYSSRSAEILKIADQIGHYSFEAYKQFIAQETANFSDQDKICLANRFGEFGLWGYDISDGIGLYTLKEMHKCMQENQANRKSSCRTCAPIHHYTGEMMEAMGLKCGLMVNQRFTYGITELTGGYDETFTKRGMHYVNICKSKSGYHMINYYSNYNIDAKNYQEAIDIGNIALGEGNFAGNQITCLDKGKNSLAECNHVYLSRSTRYQLKEIQEAINQVGIGESPVHLALTNLKQELRVAYSIKPSNQMEITENGELKQSKITYGVVSGYEGYRGEHFAQAGVVRRSETTLKKPNEKINSRASTQDLYFGVVGSLGNDSIGTLDGKQHMASFVLYLKRKDQFSLGEKDTLSLNTDFVLGSDVANGFVPRHKGLGQTNVFSVDYNHSLTDNLNLGATQRFSIMTDKANIPIPIVGATTLSFGIKDYKLLPGINLSNKSSIHFLHGGFQDETIGLQNSTSISTPELTGHGTSMTTKADIGYTSESLTGRDIFYDEGIWAEGKLEIKQNLIQKDRFNLYLQAEGGVTSGQRPAQFAIDPLTIEENPTRGIINSGYNGFIRLGGEF